MQTLTVSQRQCHTRIGAKHVILKMLPYCQCPPSRCFCAIRLSRCPVSLGYDGPDVSAESELGIVQSFDSLLQWSEIYQRAVRNRGKSEIDIHFVLQNLSQPS